MMMMAIFDPKCYEALKIALFQFYSTITTHKRVSVKITYFCETFVSRHLFKISFRKKLVEKSSVSQEFQRVPEDLKCVKCSFNITKSVDVLYYFLGGSLKLELPFTFNCFWGITLSLEFLRDHLEY